MLATWLWPFAFRETTSKQASNAAWRFDLWSFLLGLVVALVLVVWAYRYRERFVGQWSAFKENVDQLRQRLTANMATRYDRSVSETTETMHLFGGLAPFERIHVEALVQPFLTTATDDLASRPFALRRAVQSNTRLLIVGPAGSGRTMQLCHLLREESERVQKRDKDARVPILVYLPLLAAELRDEGAGSSKNDAAQCLVNTALASMSRVTATGVARWLLSQVQAGQALLLLDGWDEVTTAERPALTAWLQEVIGTFPNNHIVVSAGERGYAPLLEMGFVALQPAPWTHRQLLHLAQRWAAALGTQPLTEKNALVHLTPPTPLEATIELVTQLRGQTSFTPARKLAQVIDLLLPGPPVDAQGQPAWPLETGHRALERLALTALEQGRVVLTRDEIQTTVTQAMPPPRYAAETLQDKSLSKEEQKAAREEQDRRVLQIVDCCRALTATGGPVQTWDNRRYRFTHPVVTAFLAARCLAEANDGKEAMTAHAADPAWRDVLRFYGGLAESGPPAQHLLGAPDDLFMNRLWTASALLAAAPPGRAAGRDGLIKRLAQLFMTAQVPLLLRDRALIALIHSGEPGIGSLFKQTAQHPDPFTRAGAVLGLGALGREQDLALVEAALRDSHPDVQRAAVAALSLLARQGHAAALELLVAAMIETEGATQQMAAEALAELEPDGHTVLRDAAHDKDLLVRRGAVYGLAAVGQPWATALLKQMGQQDDQWLVRNAATEALGLEEEHTLELKLPQAETEAWLIEWAAGRGEGTGVGDAAFNTLTRALHQGEAQVRLQAALTLERLADPRAIGDLRQRLRDPEPAVRDAALAALEEIGRRHEMTI